MQVAYHPKAKRIRPEIGDEIHRCTAIWYENDTVAIETEFMKNCAMPRERFVYPVKVAIFVMGHAPGEPDEPAPQENRQEETRPPAAEQQNFTDPLPDPPRRKEMTGDSCWFEGPPLTPEEKAVSATVVRMHNNLGHPRQPDLTRLLNQYGAKQTAIDLSRRLKCSFCLKNRTTKAPRSSNMPRFGAFNSQVALDFVYPVDADGQTFQVLHVKDLAGLLSVCVVADSRDSEETLNQFLQIWVSWAGLPQKIWCDRDGAFAGSFVETLETYGCEVDKLPAEAHWQAARVENANRTLKHIWKVIADQHQLAGKTGRNLIVSIGTASYNSNVRQCGASAYQWTFGKDPVIPGDLLDATAGTAAQVNPTADSELRRRIAIRASADHALIEWRTSEAIRRSVLRATRGTPQTFQPGERVAFWRQQKVRKGKRIHPRYVVGNVIGEDKDHNYWVSSGGYTVQVAPEQLRRAYDTELWVPDDDDIRELTKAAEDETGEYRDERERPAPEEEAQEPEGTVPMSAYPDVREEEERAEEERPEGGDQEMLQQAAGELPPIPESPPKVEPTAAMDQAAARAIPNEVPETPPATPRNLNDAMDEAGEKRAMSEPPSVQPLEKKARAEIEDEALAAEVLYTTLSEHLPYYASEYFVKEPCLEVYIEEGDSEASTPRFEMTTREKKAIEREIPYSLIPSEHKAAYEEALVKEWNTWIRFGAVEVLDLNASRAAKAEYPKERFLASRVCYRNKNAAKPWMELQAKARLVARGDRDPDLLALRRDAPTMTRAGFYVMLCVVRWFGLTPFGGDITGAFMQGEQDMAKRSLPLFLKQPTEGLPGLLPDQVLLVVRGVFGLANSPRLWWRSLRDLFRRLGAKQLALDRAIFVFYDTMDGITRVVLIVGVHVDDLIGGYDRRSKKAPRIIKTITDTFDFGQWSEDKDIEYCGKEVRFTKEGVRVSQEAFIRNVTIPTVPKWRQMTPDAELTPAEVTERLSARGSLNWLTGQTRPDMAASSSLCQGKDKNVQSLLDILQVLRETVRTMSFNMLVRTLDLWNAIVLVFSDASWANAEDLSSQAGYLVFLAEPEVLTTTGGTAVLVEWRTHRLKRKCKSTLTAETIAMEAATDAGLHTRQLLAEMLYEKYQPGRSGELDKTLNRMVAITDCKSLYDCLVKDGPQNSLSEKRLAVDMAGLQDVAAEFDEENPSETFKWIPGDKQLADGMTKKMPTYKLRELLCRDTLSVVA